MGPPVWKCDIAESAKAPDGRWGGYAAILCGTVSKRGAIPAGARFLAGKCDCKPERHKPGGSERHRNVHQLDAHGSFSGDWPVYSPAVFLLAGQQSSDSDRPQSLGQAKHELPVAV